MNNYKEQLKAALSKLETAELLINNGRYKEADTLITLAEEDLERCCKNE